jgi:hypothetical protein
VVGAVPLKKKTWQIEKVNVRFSASHNDLSRAAMCLGMRLVPLKILMCLLNIYFELSLKHFYI